ncbi:acetylcholine receptor subunit beta-like 2 isoform X1 [Patella vulgata]|uniref:acetylcholine receptor subunit beta-like 2 isoform X1 n=2 Tax=Patella vulgata TaxID=6465 RepID=UPI0024A8E8D0|nr:acetylcholine receptor subunit beta-like 2 isoform X1 [Patella vulgata]
MKTWTLCGILFMDIIVTQVLGDRIVSDANKNEAQLYKDLFTNYTNAIMPLKNETGSVTVRLGLSLYSIIEMDEIRERLDVSAVLFELWTDERLEWDPSRYGNIKTLRVPASVVWRPDVVLYNGMGDERTFNDQSVGIYNGIILWIPAMRLQATCEGNLLRFPFDKQTCKFNFGSWTYHGNELNLTYLGGNALEAYKLSEFVASGNDWKLLEYTADILVLHYPCCSEPYHTMVFTVVLERKPMYYIHVYILPAVILSLLIPFQLFLPPESRERLTVGSILIISNIMMIFKLQEILPIQHVTLPLLGIFYSLNLIWSFLSLIATICVLNVHNRGPRRGRVPDIIRWVFLRSLKRIVCLGNDNYYPLSSTDCVSMKGLENPVLSSSTDGQKAKETNNGYKLEADVEDLNRQLHILTARARTNEVKEEMLGEWRQVSLVLDRVLFFLFMLTILIYTVVLLG